MQKESNLIDVSALNEVERVVLADILVSDMAGDKMAPLTADQKELLLSRLKEAKQDPDIYVSWNEVRAKLTKRPH